MARIHQAIELIKEGRKKDAQSILSDLIRSDPHDIKSWFWYAETLDTAAKRIELLEACRKQNPADPKVLKALEMLRNNQTLHPPSQPLNRPSQPVHPQTQPPFASSPTPTTPRSDYYSPYPIKYEDEGETINPITGLPDPTASYDSSPRRGQPIGVPNIHVPINDMVLDYLKSVVPYLSEIQRLSTGAVNYDRVHSDYSDNFFNTVAKLPEDSKYIIYGFPALVHPKTGIIFGYAMGMSNKYRLPEMLAQEYRQYLDLKNGNNRKNKGRSKKVDTYTPPPLEENWVDSMNFSGSLVQKCYDYYGIYPNTNAIVHFNADEDLYKPPPPTAKAQVNFFFHRISSFVFVFLVCLVLGAFLYASANGITFLSILNSFLDWLLVRR